MKPARILVICIAAVAAIGLALVVRAMGSGGSATQVAAAAPVQQTPMTKVLVGARRQTVLRRYPVEGLARRRRHSRLHH